MLFDIKQQLKYFCESSIHIIFRANKTLVSIYGCFLLFGFWMIAMTNTLCACQSKTLVPMSTNHIHRWEGQIEIFGIGVRTIG